MPLLTTQAEAPGCTKPIESVKRIHANTDASNMTFPLRNLKFKEENARLFSEHDDGALIKKTLEHTYQ